MGSVFKRGEHYAIRYDLPPGPDGKRRQKMVSCKGLNKKQSEQKLRDILTAINQNGYIEPGSRSVSQYLDEFIKNYACVHTSPNTYERYAELIQNNIVPHIGNYRLDRINTGDIQAYYNKLLTSGRVDKTGGLSAQTILHIHRLLHRAFKQAIQWGYITRNPVDGAVLPKIERKQLNILSFEESLQLLECSRSSQYFFAPVLLCIATGMRRGEILALKWANINLELGIINVMESLEDTSKGIRFKETKTTGSTRAIQIPDFAIDELKWWKVQQAKHKLALGDMYNDIGLVCTKQNGSPIKPDTFSTTFKNLVRRAGVSDISFHDLRHSYATMLIMSGVPVKVVSEMMGHTNVVITQDTYTHVLPTMQKQAANKLNDIYMSKKLIQNC